VSSLLQAEGGRVLELLRERSEREQQAERLRAAAERRLRLRRLARDLAISHDR
jgi:hypothetical protein